MCHHDNDIAAVGERFMKVFLKLDEKYVVVQEKENVDPKDLVRRLPDGNMVDNNDRAYFV